MSSKKGLYINGPTIDSRVARSVALRRRVDTAVEEYARAFANLTSSAGKEEAFSEPLAIEHAAAKIRLRAVLDDLIGLAS